MCCMILSSIQEKILDVYKHQKRKCSLVVNSDISFYFFPLYT